MIRRLPCATRSVLQLLPRYSVWPSASGSSGSCKLPFGSRIQFPSPFPSGIAGLGFEPDEWWTHGHSSARSSPAPGRQSRGIFFDAPALRPNAKNLMPITAILLRAGLASNHNQCGALPPLCKLGPSHPRRGVAGTFFVRLMIADASLIRAPRKTAKA